MLKNNKNIVLMDLRPLQTGYAAKGIGRYTRELATRLSSRFAVSSLIFREIENPLPSIPVGIEAPLWKRPWLWDQIVLPMQLFRHRVSLFHNFVALGPLHQISYPVFYAHRTLATLYDWHMFGPHAGELDRFYRSTWRIRLQKACIHNIRHLVVISEEVRADTLAHTKLCAQSITVAPCAGDHLDQIEDKSFTVGNQPDRNRKEEAVILSIGDTPNKNLRLAFSVADGLRSVIPHLKWLVLGAPMRVLGELRFTPAQKPPWVEIVDSSPDAFLKSCYRRALCLLFTSSSEGFGIPVLEAMRLGCPVAATNMEPLRAIVADSHSLHFPDQTHSWIEHIKKLHQESVYRSDRIELGRKNAARFSWGNSAEIIATIYAEKFSVGRESKISAMNGQD